MSLNRVIQLKEVIENGDFKPMPKSDAEGIDLLGDKDFGAGIIRFPAKTGVDTHTHPGPHCLQVLSGTGVLQYKEEESSLSPGELYFIPANVKHAILATSELVLLVIGKDYKKAADPERLEGGGSLKDKKNV